MTDWKEEWKELVNMTHTEQGIWFLNGFWDEVEEDKEDIWNMVHTMIEIECGEPKLYGRKKWEGKEGCELDQFQAHQFLEKFGETLTVKELSAQLNKIDIDNNKKMCMTEYLTFKYQKDGPSVVMSPQGGGDPEEFKRGKQAFKAAQEAHAKAMTLNEEAKEALAALEAEEKTLQDEITKLENKIEKPTKKLSAVKLGTLKSQLAQLKDQDPLPLQKAKLTANAAAKKSKKAAKASGKRFDEAKAIFDKLKLNGGAALGAIWWMERTLDETEKFSPKKKKKKKQCS